MREVEIKERELRLLQKQVGTSNTTRVHHPSSHCPSDLPLMKSPPPCFRSARKWQSSGGPLQRWSLPSGPRRRSRQWPRWRPRSSRRCVALVLFPCILSGLTTMFLPFSLPADLTRSCLSRRSRAVSFVSWVLHGLVHLASLIRLASLARSCVVSFFQVRGLGSLFLLSLRTHCYVSPI